MSSIINFYNNSIPIPGTSIFITDIIHKWSDYDIQTNKQYVPWVFPQKIDDNDLPYFQYKNIRNNLLNLFLRMINFFGFHLDKQWKIYILDKPKILYGEYMGLYFSGNYIKITRMLDMYNFTGLPFLSYLLIYIICFASNQKDDNDIIKSNIGIFLSKWKQIIKKTPEYKNRQEKEERTSEPIQSSVTCNSFQGLVYTGNSCYQDSVLFALFAIPNNFIDKYILFKNFSDISHTKKWISCSDNSKEDLSLRIKIQKELLNLTAHMRKETKEQIQSCSNLRKLFENCKGSQEFHGTGQQDAGEFLTYLLSIFQVNFGSTQTITYIGQKDKLTTVLEKIEDTTASPIVQVASWFIHNNPEKILYTKDFLTQSEDTLLDNPYVYKGVNYFRRKYIWKFISPNFFIINVQRSHLLADGNFVKLKKIIIPSLHIKIGDKTATLYAIVKHERNHYTCYIQCGENWYFYDDMSTDIFIVKGGYSEVVDDTKRDGVLFFYK